MALMTEDEYTDILCPHLNHAGGGSITIPLLIPPVEYKDQKTVFLSLCPQCEAIVTGVVLERIVHNSLKDGLRQAIKVK